MLRGELTNPYDEPVETVRLIVRLRGDGEHPREMERIETELRIAIKPNGQAPFRRELTTGCTSNFSDLSIVAFATRRGGVELAVPTLEIEIAASKVEEAASSAGNVPALGNVGGWGAGLGVNLP